MVLLDHKAGTQLKNSRYQQLCRDSQAEQRMRPEWKVSCENLHLATSLIFTCDPDKIWEIRPLGTMIAGEWVYLNPQLSEIISSDEHPLL